MARPGFWPLAPLWLSAGTAAQAAVRFEASASVSAGPGKAIAALGSLAFLAPCSLPLALGCRRLWRLSHRRAAWATGIGPGTATVAAMLFAGLLGAGGHCYLGRPAQPPGLARLAMARAARMTADVGRPVVERSRQVRSPRGRPDGTGPATQ